MRERSVTYIMKTRRVEVDCGNSGNVLQPRFHCSDVYAVSWSREDGLLSYHNITQACDAALLMLVMMSSHRFIDPSSVSALRHPRIFTRCAALQPQPCNFHHPVHGLCVTSKDPLDPVSVDGSCCRGRMLSLGVNVYSFTRWLQLRFDRAKPFDHLRYDRRPLLCVGCSAYAA